jgi:hypothetical protein
MRRGVGLIMVVMAFFAGAAQYTAVVAPDQDATFWGWIPVVVLTWLAVLNLKPKRSRRALDRGPSEDP